MTGLPYEFSDKEVSPWGGLRLVEEVYRMTGLPDYLVYQCPDLTEPGSNRGNPTRDLMEDFMVSVILGARRIAHSGTLRYDSVVQRIFEWKKGMARELNYIQLKINYI